MFGCLRRIGCLAVLLLAGLAWVGRDYWYAPVAARLGIGDEGEAADAAVPTWQPLDQAQAESGERKVRALARREGPVYQSLRAGELASYAFLSLAEGLPAGLDSAQAAVIGDRVYVKAPISPRDFAGVLGGAGGALGGLLDARDTLRLGGTLEVVRPGLAQLRVREVQLGTFPLPAAAIPRLMARFRGAAVVDGVADDAIPLRIPDYIGDVRVARGRVTLYRATP